MSIIKTVKRDKAGNILSEETNTFGKKEVRSADKIKKERKQDGKAEKKSQRSVKAED